MINGQREVFPFEEKYTVEYVAEKLGVSVEKVEKRLRWFPNATDEHRHTKQYVLSGLYENGLKWYPGSKGIILKGDFIEGYYKVRDEIGKRIFNYDFSNIPDVIPTKKTKVPVFVNETSTKTKKLIGEWKTSYKEFVIDLQENRVCAGMISKEKTNQYISTEDFIAKSKQLFPGKFEYDKTIYVNNHTKVILKCLTCGEYFEQMPGEHIYGTGQCPACARLSVGRQNAISQEEFKNRVKEIYGDTIDLSKAVYLRASSRVGRDSNVTVIDSRTGKEYSVPARSLLYGSFNFDRVKSRGENHVAHVLDKLEIKYIPQFRIGQEDMFELIDIQKNVYVDFFLENYKGFNYIIEYNGTQHYFWRHDFQSSLKDYSKQLQRDEAIRSYCERIGIKLIVIPYNIKEFKDILDVLQKILIDGEDISSVIPIIEPKKPEEYE
jgi:hypothetical protein